MAQDSIGIGFIGSSFARRVQAPAFVSIPGVKLLGCASPNNAGNFAKEFNMPFSSGDWKELINQPGVDLVCITSTPEHHFEQAMYALEKGKHILCEKPFTLTTTQARKLSEAAASSDKLCLLDHELRFTPAARFIKSQLSRYELGEIFYASAISELNFRNNINHPYNWWSDKSKGGGSWGAIGSHLIDLVRFLVDEISAADTTLSTGIKKRKDHNDEWKEVTSDDIAASILRFRSGATGFIFSSTTSNEFKFDIVISGEKGAYKMDIDSNLYFMDPQAKTTKLDIPLTDHDKVILERIEKAGLQTNKFSKAFFFYSDAIITAIKNNERILPCAATFEDGYLTQQVLETGWQTP